MIDKHAMEQGRGTPRRSLLQGALATAAAVLLPREVDAQAGAPATTPISSTSEPLPVVGLGSWIAFNVGNDPKLKDECTAVMAAFFEAGGRMIDCSPMYGSSQPTIGYGLKKLVYPQSLLSAEKVWISNPASGPDQIERSRAHWGVPRFDLLQVHNLLSWKPHLQTLLAMKAEGRVRYVGITTSEGRRHDEIERIMASQPIDFVQVTYNVRDREVEARQPGQEGCRRQAQAHVPVPPMPGPCLTMVETEVVLGPLEALLNRPAQPRRASQFAQRSRAWGIRSGSVASPSVIP